MQVVHIRSIQIKEILLQGHTYIYKFACVDGFFLQNMVDVLLGHMNAPSKL